MSFLTVPQIANVAIELLQRQFVLAGTVARVPADNGASGGVLFVRVPHEREARIFDRATGHPIELSKIEEHGVPVSVKHIYDAAPVTDEDLTMSIGNFATQVIAPMTDAVARRAEDELAGVFNALPPADAVSWATDPDPDADIATVLAIRKHLTDVGAPMLGRTVAVSPSIANRILGCPLLVAADHRGSADALETATLGQIYGLTFVESPAIEDGTAVGYARSAAVLATAAPADPGGGAEVQTVTVEAAGVTLRVLSAYDVTHFTKIVAVSVFAGASPVTVDGLDDVEDPDEDDGAGEVVRAIRVTTE